MPSATARSTRRSGASTSARKPSRTASTRNTRRAAQTRQTPPAPAPEALPAWSDLGGKQRKASKKGGARTPVSQRAAGRLLDAAPSLRFGVWTLVACIAVTLYVGHVFATQATLAELQQARRDNLRLHLTHERLQGAYDRMTGPNEVLGRAAALGLEEGIAYGPVIRLDD